MEDDIETPWQGRNPQHPWNEDLRSFGWPESGDGGVSVEVLYQAFKARLMAEVVAEGGRIYDTTKSKTVPYQFVLVDRVKA